jgi:integrase
MPEANSTPKPAANKPAKPYADFPLYAHAAGVWAKRIRGKLCYFGPWADPDAALAKYLAEKDALHAGKTPRPDPDALTVKDVANAFLNARREAVEAGELAERTWLDYRSIMEKLVDGLGKHKPVSAIDPQDFTALKSKLAKRNGPARMSTIVQVIRCAFGFAYESGMLAQPVRFGPVFKRTSKKVMRLHRAKQGPRLFAADEIRRMVGAAGVQLKAMLLLGINCAFGPSDCARLPIKAIDLDAAVVQYPRAKTGVHRKCFLWVETIAAIKDVLAIRKEPENGADAGLVFVTKYRKSWAKDNCAGPIVAETRKLLKRLGINGRYRLGFYCLRRTFRTIGDETKDSVGCDAIMGHETPYMSSVYRETISDERLIAVSNYVHAWLFGAVQ